jgi:hypothetical protein
MSIDALFDQTIRRLGGIARSGYSDADPLAPFSEEELRVIELRCGSPLPSDYRRFIERFGGCTFGATGAGTFADFPWLVSIPRHVSPTRRTLLNAFFGPRFGVESADDLLWQIDLLADSLPDSMIPIAECFGNKLCIGIRGPDKEKIYYWDRETEPVSESDFLVDFGRPMTEYDRRINLFLVAESFAGFLETLQPVQI